MSCMARGYRGFIAGEQRINSAIHLGGTIPPMKVYVRGYDTVEPAPPTRPFAPVENIAVQYSETPEWRVSTFHADYELRTLRGMNIHVGDHYCDFALEKLTEDEFAIVCDSHPLLRR